MERPIDFSKARLLIVDDEHTHMTALCNTLTDRGFVTDGFATAEGALQALQCREYDVLLTDLMMPGMDGIELLRRAQEIQPYLVGVLMTGHGTIDTAVEAMKVGALDYVLKPFKLSVVLPVLTRALGVRRLRVENAALIRRVRERTLELEAANRDLEAFSTSVSHDLLAPLRAVRGFADILETDFAKDFPDEARQHLSRVSAGARRMEQLIWDLLKFSRSGRGPLGKTTVNMSKMVQEVAKEMRLQQPERQIDLRVSVLPDAFADPSLLRQVFVNLLSNAFKFTRNREIAVIEVAGHVERAETLYSIRDNGAGFDMNDVDRLFGVFHRLHDEDEFEGNGVGLSIVHRIIERHGGRVWAEGAVDRGATLCFAIPAG
jgi:two-component system sensor histidine kinase/response regulator